MIVCLCIFYILFVSLYLVMVIELLSSSYDDDFSFSMIVFCMLSIVRFSFVPYNEYIHFTCQQCFTDSEPLLIIVFTNTFDLCLRPPATIVSHIILIYNSLVLLCVGLHTLLLNGG